MYKNLSALCLMHAHVLQNIIDDYLLDAVEHVINQAGVCGRGIEAVNLLLPLPFFPILLLVDIRIVRGIVPGQKFGFDVRPTNDESS